MYFSTAGTVVILMLLQGGSDNEFMRSQLQFEDREKEMDRLESKMLTGAKLLADNDLRLRQLEFSLVDNTIVDITAHCHFYNVLLLVFV